MILRTDDGKAGKKTDHLLEVLEKIDDDCDAKGLHFVKIKSEGAADAYGIETLPTLVFYRNQVPNMYDGKEVRSILKLYQSPVH